MIWIVLYIGTVFGANWALLTFGLIPVGFGLLAPAGVLFAGLAVTLRDFAQEAVGRRGVLLAILAGALLSAALYPGLDLRARHAEPQLRLGHAGRPGTRDVR